MEIENTGLPETLLIISAKSNFHFSGNSYMLAKHGITGPGARQKQHNNRIARSA
jgi:hypothetical protein